MKSLKLEDLNLSLEESRDIIQFLARKRGINNYRQKLNDELLNALKRSEKKKRKKINNKKLYLKINKGLV